MPARLGRRGLLGYVGSAAAGAAAGGAGMAVASRSDPPSGAAPAGAPTRTWTPYGAHQPGVAAPTPHVLELVALDLHPEVDTEALGRLLRLWTGDVVALSAGRPAPGDTAPGLATAGADLTITVALGARAVHRGLVRHGLPGLAEIPPMRHDRLDPAWSGGDLLAAVGARDATTVAHAVRRLVADAAPFARLRWRQQGSWNGLDPQGRPMTGRNLFGQVDGSRNPSPGTGLFDSTVWVQEGPWAGGTSLVVRRIRMDLDAWDRLTRDEQDRALGRRTEDGAPLSGGAEHDDVDLRGRDHGRRTVAVDAHVRRAHPASNGGARIFRKGVNYVHDRTVEGRTALESGLLFLSFQADLSRQFVPIQRSLDELDALNEWTTAVGSASFAVLPGFEEGGWLGETLLS